MLKPLPDPETYAWDLLDPDLLARLSARKYVSLSRERALRIPAHSPSTFLQSASLTTSNFSSEIAMGPEAFQQANDYVNGRSDQPAANQRSLSLFEADMPGVMTAEEVREQIDLGSWKLILGSRATVLENLVGWEESEMTDPDTVKGTVAEFAACIGPELVEETGIKFAR